MTTTVNDIDKEICFSKSISKPKKLFFQTISNLRKNKIFLSKKLKRNGLLEKKKILMNSKINAGRWTNEEHRQFLISCHQYGPVWKKIQSDVKTRTTAQIRSHAQKYVIKLCKKYNIEIKSRRRLRFISEHLNFPYRRKSQSYIIPLERMTEEDKKFIQNFNFYEKKIDFAAVERLQDERKNHIFTIIKDFKAIPEVQENIVLSSDHALRINELFLQGTARMIYFNKILLELLAEPDVEYTNILSFLQYLVNSK